jgi:hypothetical protein
MWHDGEGGRVCGGDNPLSGQRNHPFREMRIGRTATLPREHSPNAYWRKTAQDEGAAPIRQDRGAIEVGWDSIAPGEDESRSPRR